MSSRHRNAEALLNLMIVKDKMFEQMGDAGFPTKIWICLHKPDFKHVGTKQPIPTRKWLPLIL